VVAADAEWLPMSSTSATPKPIMGEIDQKVDTMTATTPTVFNYVASADVTLPTLNGKTVAKVRRVFQKQQLSPWNFAIFYVDPLEIHPGPEFHVTGWVHTNSNLYTGHDTLHFEDKVTYGSEWSVGFKPGDGQHPETPSAPHYLNNLPPARDIPLQPFGLDSSQLLAGGNTNDDSYRELIEPPSSSSDPLSNVRYWDQASVAIEVDAAGTPKIGLPNPDGTVSAFNVSPQNNPSNPNYAKYQALYNMFNASGTITTNQMIQNDREGLDSAQGQVRLVTLDISKIETVASGKLVYKANTGSNAYFNGIVYIYDKSASSTAKRGVRLKNGSSIPSAGLSAMGLTLVSNNPVYIQGDFNTGGTGASVPSNVVGAYNDPDDPPNPQVSGYTRAPCSILADAVNILSNGVVDNNLGSAPDATANTTVNTAIIAGIVQTSPVGGDGAYSGGAENFPRFLEDWSTKTLTYYGSMVELFQSQQATGKWTNSASVYSPPVRQWYFDTNFKTKPPPGSIMVYSYIKGRWAIAP
jgi:hypothetical protein